MPDHKDHPDHKNHTDKSTTQQPAPSGQLSESAQSHTSDPNQAKPDQLSPEHKPQPDSDNAGKHGRPTDDSDPGHS